MGSAECEDYFRFTEVFAHSGSEFLLFSSNVMQTEEAIICVDSCSDTAQKRSSNFGSRLSGSIRKIPLYIAQHHLQCIRKLQVNGCTFVSTHTCSCKTDMRR